MRADILKKKRREGRREKTAIRFWGTLLVQNTFKNVSAVLRFSILWQVYYLW